MAADVAAILTRRTLHRSGRRGIEPVREWDIGWVAALMVMMVVDVAIGSVGPELEQGMAMGGFATGAEVGWEEKQAKERHAPKESRPDLRRLIAE